MLGYSGPSVPCGCGSAHLGSIASIYFVMIGFRELSLILPVGTWARIAVVTHSIRPQLPGSHPMKAPPRGSAFAEDSNQTPDKDNEAPLCVAALGW